MNNRRIIKNIGISLVMKPISMLLALVYTPIVLSFLGEAKYGVWAIILNIVTWINYFDIGIGNGLRNKLTEAIALDDKDAAKVYVSTAYVGTALISATFFVTILLIWNVFGLSDFFNLNLPDEDTNTVIAISTFFVCLNFVLSLSKTSAYAIQQPSVISVVGVFGQILQIGILIIVTKVINQSLYAISYISGFTSVFASVVIYVVVVRNRPFLRPKLSLANIRYLKPLLTLGIGFFVLQICTLILNTTDNLLISNLYGSAEVTPYSIAYKFFYMAVQVHAIIIMPMWSAYTEAATRKDMQWIKATMKKINIITLAISIGVILGIFIFEPFAAIWLGKKLVYGRPLIIIIAAYMIAQMIANNYSSFLCGVGYIKVSVVVAGIGAIINIPLSILFAQGCQLRLAGIILGSFVVAMLSTVLLPVVSHKWIRDKEITWKDQITDE